MRWGSSIRAFLPYALPYGALAVIASLLHFVWEYLHLPLYTGYETLGQGTCLIIWASAGDVLYTVFVVLFVAACKRNLLWFKTAKTPEYILLGVLGLVTAVFVEYKAHTLHRWAYAALMPTLWGFGLSPLVQMTLLLPLSVYLTNSFYQYTKDRPL